MMNDITYFNSLRMRGVNTEFHGVAVIPAGNGPGTGACACIWLIE